MYVYSYSGATGTELQPSTMNRTIHALAALPPRQHQDLIANVLELNSKVRHSINIYVSFEHIVRTIFIFYEKSQKN